MTADSTVGFGALELKDDQGGPRQQRPKDSSSDLDRLVNEQIEKHKFIRQTAKFFCFFMAASAAACLGFTAYIICHFFAGLDSTPSANLQTTPAQFVIINQNPSNSEIFEYTPASEATKKPQQESNTPNKTPDPTASMFAPLIPASLTGALGLIILITMARFITNYSNIQEESRQQEYGAISALVQEIGKLIKAFKGGE